MPTIPLEDLVTPLTRTDVETKIYEVMATVGVRTTAWKPGAVVRTMVTGCSIVIAAFSTLAAKLARSGFLELAEGVWLALVAWYVYGVAKDYATFAEGYVTLTNTGGGIYDLDAEDLIVSNPTTGKQYRNTTAFSLPALSALTIPIRAIEVGAASTSAPGTITEVFTGLLGVTCTNALAVVGYDEESDPTLRARCGEKLGALSPMGPWDAYSHAARTAVRSDGAKATVTRMRTIKDGFGNVTTYVATASGAVSGAIGNLATDLGAIDEAIQQAAAPLAVTASTASATAVPIAVTYRVWMYNTSGLTQAEIEDAIEARLITFMSGQPIGGNKTGSDPGKVYHDAIRTVIGATLPQIFHVVVDAPVGDTSLTISQVPVLGTVTPTSITQVPPRESPL